MESSTPITSVSTLVNTNTEVEVEYKSCIDLYKSNTNCYSDEEFEAQIEEDIIAAAQLAEIEAEMEDFN
jgi:hypothetical protein